MKRVLFSQIKDGNNVSGQTRSSFEFYDAIDRILGHRAASEPLHVLDTGRNVPNESAVQRTVANEEGMFGNPFEELGE